MTFAESAGLLRDGIFTMGEDALWRPGGSGGGIACSVLTAQPDQTVGFGDERAIVPTVLFRVRRSEIATPAAGDTVTIGTDVFTIIGEPLIDKYRGIWTCQGR